MALSNFVNNKFFVSSSIRGGGHQMVAPAPALFSIEKLRKNPTANRCLNMIIDAAASVPYEIKDEEEKLGTTRKTQPPKLRSLVNRKANNSMDSNFFWRCIIMDLLTDGNAFILIKDGLHYYLPAVNMTVIGDSVRLVKHFELGPDGTKFKPEEIIHIKDNTTKSILRGESRFASMADIVDLHGKMKAFQKNFFNNNAMPGIILESPNTLTEKLKQRKLEQWKQDFNALSGARSPAFLDGGITAKNLETSTFREMDFENSIQSLEKDIAKTMGVPPVLLDGGNNANITPNLRLFYLETVIPICKKIAAAISLAYGYEITPDEVAVKALQPDLKDLSNYVSTLKNGGIMTGNEAREAVGLPKSDDPEADELITPANVAGSAANPATGGRPKEPDTGED